MVANFRVNLISGATGMYTVILEKRIYNSYVCKAYFSVQYRFVQEQKLMDCSYHCIICAALVRLDVLDKQVSFLCCFSLAL
jgi:hypothetical protein